MDIENELDEFKKQNTPALVGASVRGEEDSGEPSRSASRPVIKNTESRSNFVTLADLKAEGGLVDDTEGQMDAILDGEGHLKSDVLTDEVKMVPKAKPASETEGGVDVAEDNHMSVFGGNADAFVVPASGKASGYAGFAPKTKKVSPVTLVQDMELIHPEKVKSVDDIIDEVNTGKKSAAQDSLSRMMKDIEDLDFELGDEHEVQLDSEFIAPAARREGSSAAVTPVATPSDARGRSLARDSPTFKPHLARGDSYHGGLNDENVHHPINSSTHGERLPRHDPGAVRPAITNSSSLSYLRTISRSRSRMANDRKALGEDLSLDELKASGGLVNEASQETSTAPTYEDAIKKAMEFVDNTHVKTVKGNVGLEDVAEGGEPRQRTGLNSDDLLDRLANSAKELMLSEDEEDKEDEEERNEIDDTLPTAGESSTADPDADDDSVADLTIQGEAEEKEEGVEDQESVGAEKEVEPSEKEIEKGDSPKENVVDGTNENEPETEMENAEQPEQMPIDEANKVGTDDADEELPEEPSDTTEEHTDKPADKYVEDTCSDDESEAEESEKPLNVPPSVEEETDDTNGPETSDSGHVIGEEDPEEEEDLEAILAAAMAEQAAKGRAFDKNDELSVLVAGAVKEEKDKADNAEFDALVAGVARERALQSESSAMGQDGSVFVPKAAAKMTFEHEPVYIYTSLAGGFHIHNRTNRLITILTVNKIPYTVRDLGTDEEAKSIWRRFCGGKTLPGIVRGKDDYIGNWEDVEEANENYAIRTLIYESF